MRTIRIYRPGNAAITTFCFFLASIQMVAGAETTNAADNPKVRARELGIAPGILPTGPLNAITDVAGVRVGHVTVIEGNSVRTGATAILPHGGNLYQDKVPAGLHVANGFGKLAGVSQIDELGEIETPIVLTNTLAVSRGIDAVIDWTLAQDGNDEVRSVNAVVGETNDSTLNDIRGRALTPEKIIHAIQSATSGPVEEGAVGAGTGTVAFGWKGGIGTSSRRLPGSEGGYTVGVLVQSNFGGNLTIAGRSIDSESLRRELAAHEGVGSIMMIVATDAPLSDRNLERLARRAPVGLARTGASFSNGSGDYAIAFSTAMSVRRTAARRARVSAYEELSNDAVSPLFQAVAEATEEAIYNSLLMAETTSSYNRITGNEVTIEKFPIEAIKRKPAPNMPKSGTDL
ncbi:MAG TPA: P1 family peptidase [Woeseiaceae bacterium]|nr:P1 family peptidase [Woeseiaceae bacterium]